MSQFIKQEDVQMTDFDWGSAGMRLTKDAAGCESLVVMDVTLTPGGGHNFHRHPNQDELIIVKSGTVVQWIGEHHEELHAGDSVYLDKDVVHASFNEGNVEAELQVILAPSVGEGSYELVDVSGDAPWNTLRG